MKGFSPNRKRMSWKKRGIREKGRIPTGCGLVDAVKGKREKLCRGNSKNVQKKKERGGEAQMGPSE